MREGMSRTLALLLTAALCFALFGCVKDPSIEETSAPSEPTTATQPTEPQAPTIPPEEDYTDPVVDNGDTTEFALTNDKVQLGVINAGSSEETYYDRCPPLAFDYPGSVVIMTKDIKSIGLYTADGQPIYAIGYQLFCDNSEGEQEIVGFAQPGSENSNAYTLISGDYRITRIDTVNNLAWIRIYYEPDGWYGIRSRGVEFSHLSYNHVIQIQAWEKGVTNETGISINNGKPTAEQDFVNEQPDIQWEPFSYPVNGDDVYGNLINTRPGGNGDQSLLNMRFPRLVIYAHNIKSFGLYTADGHPIYAIENLMYYDDDQGIHHRVGVCWEDGNYYNRDQSYTDRVQSYELDDGEYYIGQVDSYGHDSWIEIRYLTRKSDRLSPSDKVPPTNDYKIFHLEPPEADQKIAIKPFTQLQDGGSGVTVCEASGSDFRLLTQDTYFCLLNSKTGPEILGWFENARFRITATHIKSMAIFTAEGYPVYGDGGYLYYDDAQGVAHRFGYVDDINLKLHGTYQYSFYDGDFYIGRIVADGEDASIRIGYQATENQSEIYELKDGSFDENTTIYLGAYYPGKLEIRRDEDVDFDFPISSEEVFLGLANAKSGHADYQRPKTNPLGATKTDDPDIPDKVIVMIQDIKSMGIYTADGDPVYLYHNNLYYDASDGSIRHIGSRRDYAGIPPFYVLNHGEYRIAWIEPSGDNPQISLCYILDTSASYYRYEYQTFENLDNNDVILIRQWQPGMTNEDGILIQRG